MELNLHFPPAEQMSEWQEEEEEEGGLSHSVGDHHGRRLSTRARLSPGALCFAVQDQQAALTAEHKAALFSVFGWMFCFLLFIYLIFWSTPLLQLSLR